MPREVVVICDGCEVVELTLDLKADKAEGGFYACDIEYELKDCGWTTRDGKDICDECSALPQTEPDKSAHGSIQSDQ